MAHNCSSIIIKCMDFRLMKEFHRFLKEENLLGDCDEVSWAGAGKDLVDGTPEEKAFCLKQIHLSHQLHHADTVFLLHHSQCGAYAQAYSFADTKEEQDRQAQDMEKAETAIKFRFPQLKVRHFWAELLDDEGKEIEFSEIKFDD